MIAAGLLIAAGVLGAAVPPAGPMETREEATNTMNTAASAKPADQAAGAVRIVLPPEAGALLKNAGGILGRQIARRCEATVVAAGDAQLAIELAIEPGMGSEGFKIADGPAGVIRISGNDERGVLYGVGKFLHGSRYDKGGFTPGPWRGTSVPASPFRGIYFATHFNNFYEAGPAGEVQEYLEELSLWGVNSLMLHFPRIQFAGLDDPAAQRAIAHIKGIIRAAKALGVKTVVGDAANSGFKSTANELLHTPVPDPLWRHGNHGVMLCPSKPKARQVILDNWSHLLDEFADVGVEYVIYWPYDEGGCGCKDCSPWGANGYPKLCRDLSRLIRVKHPRIKFIVSTWTFDTPPQGEWEGLAKSLAEDKSWADYIMADAHEDFPRYPLEKGVPGGLPLLNFPEISMWGQSPWGGYGANPLPGRLQRLWGQTQGKLSGGTPYSEGIYEDINKVICAQFYWKPDRTAEESVKEYLAFEFSPDVAQDLLEAVRIFEQNHQRGKIRESALRAFELVRKAEEKMTVRAREGWRWRIFYLRALIDKEMFERKGRLGGEALKKAFKELTRIYHAENAGPMPLKPPQVE